MDSTNQKLLHVIVESDAYSDEEFTEAASSLGKNWYGLWAHTLAESLFNPCFVIVSMEYEDDNGRTPMMIAAMLNKHSRLEILLNVYTS